MFKYIIQYLDALLKLTIEMAPWLLLGFIFAGLLKVFLAHDFLAKHMGKGNKWGPINAALLGVPLPLCSCGVIPAGLSLHKNGASKGSAVSFFISTPQTGLDSIMVTYAMLGLPFAIIRPIVAFITGIIGGYVENSVENNEKSENKSVTTKNFQPKRNRFKQFLHYAFEEFLMDIAKWLIIGLMIAALIEVILPPDFFEEQIGNGWLSILIILAGSIPLYVCATASVPIAAVLMMKGLSPGLALIFLMAGPATNAATITVIKQSLGIKTLFVYLSVIIAGAVGFGLIIDNFLPQHWFVMSHNHSNHEHLLPAMTGILATAILFFSILRGYSIRLYMKWKTKKIQNKMQNITYRVEGMGCANCSSKIEKELGNISDIMAVKANHVTCEVVVTGEEINEEIIKQRVIDLGYDFKGKA